MAESITKSDEQELESSEEYVCEVCGFKAKTSQALSSHKTYRHKEGGEVGRSLEESIDPREEFLEILRQAGIQKGRELITRIFFDEDTDDPSRLWQTLKDCGVHSLDQRKAIMMAWFRKPWAEIESEVKSEEKGSVDEEDELEREAKEIELEGKRLKLEERRVRIEALKRTRTESEDLETLKAENKVLRETMMRVNYPWPTMPQGYTFPVNAPQPYPIIFSPQRCFYQAHNLLGQECWICSKCQAHVAIYPNQPSWTCPRCGASYARIAQPFIY